MVFFIVFICLVIIIVLYLAVLIFYPDINVPPQPMKYLEEKATVPENRHNANFTSGSHKISGWIYLPKSNGKRCSCVVLTHGFCGTKDMLLEKYALRFTAAGFAALSFDYSHFGESEGYPRQFLSIDKQIEDIQSAISFLRKREEIDPDKIVIWGTSASGSYGLMIAAEDHRIAGVIGQSPSIDHNQDNKVLLKQAGWMWFIRLIINAQRDKGRKRFGLPRHYIPAVGRPGTTAMLSVPGIYDSYQKMVIHSKHFRNEVCPGAMLEPHKKIDIKKIAENIQCPVLLFTFEKDNIVSPYSYRKIEHILANKLKTITYPIGHFDVYYGEYFEKSVSEQIEFLKNIFE